MNIVSNKPSQLVKAGIDTLKTFGTAKISPPKQVAMIKAHGRVGITIYMLDGDWFTYRAAR